MKTRRKGLTLIETSIALAIISISAMGGLSYQYYSVRQMRVASVMLSGMRVGQMLLEDWKGKAAKDNYDPTQLNMGFTKDPLGTDYLITMDGQKYYVWLDHTDLATDAVSGVTLREIKCTVRWQSDATKPSLLTTDPTSVFSTYVRMGQD
jgi:prepilin-type N-terminal cleavage/methylation domain-containing protein